MGRRRARAAGASLLVVISAMCGCREAPPRAETERQAVEATQRYWVERVPNANLSRFNVQARDRGSRWELTYRWQGDQKVEPSVFVVDKQSGTVMSADFHPFERVP
jgi:hypothetical protein